MTIFVIIILVVSLAVAVLTAGAYYRQLARTRTILGQEKNHRLEISQFLARFAGGISGEEGVAGAMHSAASYVREQIDAESVAIYTVDDQQLIAAGVCGNYPLIHSSNKLVFARNHYLLEALKLEKITLGSGFLGSVVASRQAELVPLARLDSRFTDYPSVDDLGSVMVLPLQREGVLTGAICAVNNRTLPGKPFSSEQLSRLQLLGNQVSLAQQLTKVYAEISRRERIDQELDFTRSIQNSLLPKKFPQWGGFTINARTRSAKEVNGDFYDFIQIDDNRMLVVLGDACGKGMPACLMAAMARSFVRSLAAHFTTLRQFMIDLNSNMNRDVEAGKYVTMNCCLLDRRDSMLEFGRGGHTDLTVYVHRHLRIISPDGTGFGVVPSEFANYDTMCIAVDQGTTLMLFSDGMSEATNFEQQEYGVQRLTESFQSACDKNIDPEAIIGQLMKEVSSYELTQSDDQTVVIIKHK